MTSVLSDQEVALLQGPPTLQQSLVATTQWLSKDSTSKGGRKYRNRKLVSQSDDITSDHDPPSDHTVEYSRKQATPLFTI